ncbi:MAG TPA: iron-containing alcohol dehydrogenase [Candidatus Thermoplasmatota archaeon]|nr:iron-containing alcohol dehydrogenase [Candidatus Thermoplasmatota archaeon]
MKSIVQRFDLPATCRLGWGTREGVGEDARRLAGGGTALLVTTSSMRTSQQVKEVTDRLQEKGFRVVVDDHANHVPDNARVNEGAAVYRANDCGLIVSVGGGNTHDLAKAIGAVVVSGRSIVELEGVDRLRGPNPPHIAVNTTAGTGSELSRYTFITSHRKGRRVMVSDRRITPRVAINDPHTHLSMPRALTASGGINVLAHAVEAYLSRAAMPLTDDMALDAIDLVRQYLERAVKDGHDEEARTAMAQAEQLAGMAYNSAGLGLADGISLTLSAVYDVPHGECNAILLPYVLAYNMPVAKERIAEIGKALGAEGRTDELARGAVSGAYELAQRVGIHRSMGELGVDQDVAYMCLWSVMKNPLLANNPRPITEEGLAEIFVESVSGDPPEEAIRRLSA